MSHSYSFSDILAAIPHRPPMLFVDEIVELHAAKGIHCRIRNAQSKLMLQFLILEGLMQASGILMYFSKGRPKTNDAVVTSLSKVEFSPEYFASASRIIPSVIDYHVELQAWRGAFEHHRGEATSDGHRLVCCHFSIVNSS